MNSALRLVYLVRHGDTAWTLTARHIVRNDLPLTEQGGTSLTALLFYPFSHSPLQRAAARPSLRCRILPSRLTMI